MSSFNINLKIIDCLSNPYQLVKFSATLQDRHKFVRDSLTTYKKLCSENRIQLTENNNSHCDFDLSNKIIDQFELAYDNLLEAVKYALMHGIA